MSASDFVARHHLGRRHRRDVGHQQQLAVHQLGAGERLVVDLVGEELGLQIHLDDGGQVRLGHLGEEARLGAGVRQGPPAAALAFVLGVELVAEGLRAGLQLGDAALALHGLFGRALGVVRHHQPTPEPQGFVHRLGGRGCGVARCSLRLRARGFGSHLLLEAPQHGFELAIAAARHGQDVLQRARPCHSRGPVWCTLVPLESITTVNGMSRTSNS